MNYFEQSNAAYLHAYGRYDLTFDHGKGMYLYDIHGKEYLDFYAGIGVNALGYGNQEYVEAMQKQLASLMHVSNYFNTVPGVEAALAITKATGMHQVFFTNSGTEATEGALKLARKYYYKKHQKADSQIISLHHSFHGRSTGSLKLTGNPAYQEAFGPLIDDVYYASINDIESVKACITDKTAAIILEPVQGEGGLRVCTKEFLHAVRNLCDEHDIVLILDEIQCGMGRTGSLMTYMQYDIKPDILCLAKAIGAGFPVGAFLASQKVGAAMEPGDHGSTYGGNPLATMAVKTVFDLFESQHIVENACEMGEYFTSCLDQLVESTPCILERRGLGLMQGLVFDHPVGPYVKKAQEKGLLFVTAGPTIIRMLPPLIVTKQHIDQCISILKQLIDER